MKFNFISIFFLSSILLFVSSIFSEGNSQNSKIQENSLPLKFGAFVDSYHSSNFNKPSSRERAYTTQSVRNDEFNINLAHIDGSWSTDNFRGRLALQFGSSVANNYGSEPIKDQSSNQLSVRNIQEGFVGVKLLPKLWLDGGIYFGHIGHESWISQRNKNYTRAYALDFVPYYSSGVRMTYEVSEKFHIQLHVMNGWQNINENNKDKSLGLQFQYRLSNWTVTANYFGGNEAPDNQRKQTRFYQNLILDWKPGEKWVLAASQDVGWQWAGSSQIYNPIATTFLGLPGSYVEQTGRGYRQWYQGNIWISYLLNRDYRISVRWDRMQDRTQVLAQTKTQNGFNASAYVLTFDLLQWYPSMLRFELIRRLSQDPVFEYRKADQFSRGETVFVFAFSALWE